MFGPMRGGGDEVGDVVGDEHEFTRAVVGVEPARGVGEEERLHPHEPHQAGGEHHVGDVVALIVVDASLHDDDGDPFHIAEDEPAPVALGGGDGKALDVAVVEGGGDVDAVGVVAEPRAEGHADERLKIDLFPEAVVAAKQFFIWMHSGPSCFKIGIYSIAYPAVFPKKKKEFA